MALKDRVLLNIIPNNFSSGLSWITSFLLQIGEDFFDCRSTNLFTSLKIAPISTS